MSTTNERGELVYGFLLKHKGQGFTKPQLLKALGLQPGSKTEAALRYARERASEDGYHFPPAVPANGFTYMVTDLASDAIDPTLHMGRIEAGVRSRKEVGIEFLRKERGALADEDRPMVDFLLTIHDTTTEALGKIQKAADDMVLGIVDARRRQRDQRKKD